MPAPTHRTPIVGLFTDFGRSGPYVGQVHGVLATAAPDATVIDLLHEAPAFNPRAAAFLLAALANDTPPGTVLACVVDPGVGSDRRPVALAAGGRWFVGPDNGLLNAVSCRHANAKWHDITWRPEQLSDTFHGRDLFAPVAAQIAQGDTSGICASKPPDGLEDWPDDLPEVIYLDPYGNAMTGLRATEVPEGAFLHAADRCFEPVRTFSDVTPGTAIWYANSSGLAELAVNQGSAAASCALSVGTTVVIGPACD